ncbi:MAG: hypothetical protein LBB89_06485 [Treponema sp.]|jgi:hypothetical protein|nr:hypothetical protein [Treponema sp.]
MNIVNLNGKKSSQIAREYGVTLGRVNQWALEHDIQCVSFDGGATVEFYVFDAAAEEAFINRKVKPGPVATEKPPKVPGKPGRPRKEKPIDTGPKNPGGRPHKNPKKAMDIVPKRHGRGRPRKK